MFSSRVVSTCLLVGHSSLGVSRLSSFGVSCVVVNVDTYFSSQFVSRSVLAGYVNDVKKKEFKFNDLERGSWPVITRQDIQLLDRRKRKRKRRVASSEMFVVRYSSMGECARAESFFDSQIKHLSLLTFDDAMERIAGAVPVCMLHLIWTCVLDQHFVRCALSGDLECDAMTLSWPMLLARPHASIISKNL